MQRRIVIIGGVAGGATAAARARRANEHAQITLIEKDEHVSFANCGLPYYIGGEITDRSKLLLATPRKFHQWFNIDVLTRTEALRVDRQARTVQIKSRETGEIRDLPYDRLIIAPGASPIVPPLPGIDAANVFTLRNLLDTDRIKTYLDERSGGNAVVVGAGFIGLEMVEMLRHRGMNVSLVELAPQVLPPLDREMAHMVEVELARQGVGLHLGNGLKALETDGNVCKSVVLNDGTKLPADFVMLAIGVRPNIKLAQDAGLDIGKSGGIRVNATMQTSDPAIYAVGDAVEYVHGVTDLQARIPLAGPANRAGRIAGEHAATDQASPMPTVLGTAIVRVFSVTAAVTGCNRRCVDMVGGKMKAVYVPARHHVGYYPGAEEMIVKLIFNPDNGKVLGAQIVGGAGVDKRIDVIATAIRFGATISDLTTLDLAYSPPFGAAKDPVHLAAFVAENHLRGVDHLIDPMDVATLPPEVQIVDVRTEEEWKAGHLDRAVWIPLHEIRTRLNELDRSRPVAVTCRGGQRAYYAARVLKQNGFADVRNISGGMLMQAHV
ncbi:MAG: FAD-dependent oxidoreductase [Phycisphaeraceae bacterium]|nr:FAD-dependent oxidoreductase [Phycisphaeraceae bacterium]